MWLDIRWWIWLEAELESVMAAPMLCMLTMCKLCSFCINCIVLLSVLLLLLLLHDLYSANFEDRVRGAGVARWRTWLTGEGEKVRK